VRPLLEYLRQDIKAHLRDLQEGCTTIQLQEGSENVEQAQWNRIDEMNERISKLEDYVYPKRTIFQERP